VIINLSYLEDITGGDNDVILEMLDLFIRDIPTQVQKMHDFHKSSDLVSVGKEAHKLKPTLQYIGLTGMFEDIKEVEAIVKSNSNVEKLGDLIQSLQEATLECVPALKAKKAEMS
jgi:HPt (histidine-containing phosphotransfer) domain-containing protein